MNIHTLVYHTATKENELVMHAVDVDESKIHIKWKKKTVTNEYLVHDSIYVQFKNR